MTTPTGTNRPDWDLDLKNPELANHLRAQLAEVKDLELDLNVIQLGLIRNVIDEPETTTVEMILTTPFCPYGPMMIDMVHDKAEEALGKPVSVIMGAEMWDFSMTEEGLLDDWGLY
jgi:metal-sulfur cluster biosynthetic enzyme